MSAEATGWVYRHSPFKGATFAVHLALADSVNDQNGNEFWMNQAKLATKARVTRPTVNDALATLTEGGFIADVGELSKATRIRRFLFLFPAAEVVYESRHGGQVVGTDDNPLSATPTTVVSTDDTEPKGTQSEPKARKRATPFPEAFFLTEQLRAWHAKETPNVDIARQTAMFADHFRSSGAKKVDWVAAWRNWMRRAADGWGGKPGGSRPQNGPHRVDEPIDRDRDKPGGRVSDEELWGESSVAP